METRRICKTIDNYLYGCYNNDTISNCLSAYGYWENNLIKYTEKYLTDDSIILDIGANIGTWSIPLAVKNRKIQSFEPFDSSFYALCGNIFLNNKNAIRLASQEDGTEIIGSLGSNPQFGTKRPQ